MSFSKCRWCWNDQAMEVWVGDYESIENMDAHLGGAVPFRNVHQWDDKVHMMSS